MYYAIENLASVKASGVPEPWVHCGTFVVPPEIAADELQYNKWKTSLTTKHMFVSAFEGMSSCARVSFDEGNPPYKMHGLIVDFDAPCTVEKLKDLMKDPQSEFRPAYGVITRSGYARLVWHFEQPVLIAGKKQLSEFNRRLLRQFSLKSWLAGFDAGALGNPSTYFELGKSWTPLWDKDVVPKKFLDLWLYEASKNIRISDEPAKYAIPMEALADEVAKVFPGRWVGTFEEGARGVRFWDPTASDPTGAVVMKEGMMAFSGEQAFMPWRKLFGESFVQKYEADRISSIADKVVYDGSAFWMQSPDGKWKSMSKDTFSMNLRVMGFDPTRGKSETACEIDKVEVHIMTNSSVHRALPFVHFPPGIIQYNNEKYLNIATAKCMPPVADAVVTLDTIGQYAPFTHKLMRSLFIDKSLEDPYEQYYFFLAWLQRAYVTGLKQEPVQGQGIVLGGNAGVGKSLLAFQVLAPLLGGHADASGYLSGETDWTSELLHKPLLIMDDQKPIQSYETMRGFVAGLKKIIANAHIMYNEKFEKTGLVPYFGRIVVAINLDGESIKMLPDMDASSREKIMLFKCGHDGLKFPERGEIHSTLRQELPYFAKFLMTVSLPDMVYSSEKRFGVRAYWHPDLYDELLETGSVGDLHEVLYSFIKLYSQNHPNASAWVGTGSALYEALTVDSPGNMRGYTPRSLQTQLGNMHKKKVFNIERVRDPLSRMRMWKINCAELRACKTVSENSSTMKVGVRRVVKPAEGAAGELKQVVED